MLHRHRHLPSSGCRIGRSLPRWRLHPFQRCSFCLSSWLGLVWSVMKKHCVTCIACTHGSVLAITLTFTVALFASGIDMVVKYLFSLTTSLAHLTRNIVASCILA